MKIAIVGLTYPFRGGISHYCTLFTKSLNERGHDVKLFSFKRLYPKIIFPGKTQKDVNSKIQIKINAEETIDSINPFTWVNTYFKIKEFQPDLIIFQWWTTIFAPVYLTISWLVKHFSNIKILFLCHNVFPHEKILSSNLILGIVFKNSDYFIVHSKQEMDALRKLTKNKKIKMSFHPTYGHFKYKDIPKNNAKKQLGIKNNIILFFGVVKGYKGLVYLIKAMPHILKKINATLLIVGEFYEDKGKYINLIKRLNISKNVVVIDRYIPNEEVHLYFSASDVLAVPYTSATQSGVIQIAYGMNKPVISTNVGGLPEVVENNKTGFVVSPMNPKELASAVISFYKENKEKEFIINIKKRANLFSWDKMVKTIESFEC